MSEIDRVCDLAIEHYGYYSQKIKAVEEMSELTTEVCHSLIDRDHTVEEEIADCFIMLVQLQKMYNSDLVEKHIVAKLKRLEKRIKEATK
jgi:NTP pyrophosphatase (non-canonical NTP hydrolase)